MMTKNNNSYQSPNASNSTKPSGTTKTGTTATPALQPSPFVRSVLTTFERYQKERQNFSHTVAELASRETNLETLQSCSVLKHLRPLLTDEILNIRQHAATAVGRLAGFSEEVAEEIVRSGTMSEMIGMSRTMKNVGKQDVNGRF